LRDEITIILADDGAVKDGYAEYREAGFDESKLTLDGEPTRFVLRRMSYDQRKRCDAITDGPDRVEFIVRCCLVRITGLQVARADGAMGELPPVQFEDSQEYSRPMLKLSWLRDSNLPPRVWLARATVGRYLSECEIPFCAS